MKRIQFEKLTPYLILVVIALVFFLGFSWQKIADLTKTKSTTSESAPSAPSAKLSDDDLKGYAKEIGLDTEKFDSCLDSNKYQTQIDTDVQYASELSLSGTPEFFINGHFIDGTISYSEFKEIIDFELNGGDWKKAPTSITNNATTYTLDIDLTRGHTKGDKNAKVTFVEFADFECPYCEQFYSEAESQIMKDYADTGKVLFVYKNFPVYLAHPHSYEAAEAAECAADQGKFWEMHDAIFNAWQQ